MNFLPKEIENIIIDYKNQLDNIVGNKIKNQMRGILNTNMCAYINNNFILTSIIIKKIIRIYNKENKFTRKHKKYIKLSGNKNELHSKLLIIIEKINFENFLIFNDGKYLVCSYV